MSHDQKLLDECKLNAFVGELKERVHNLRHFNKTYEINVYCDDLVSEVTLAVQSAVEHLHIVEADLIGKINKYRDELMRNAQIIETEKERKEALTQQLDELSYEIESLCQRSITLGSANILVEKTNELKCKLRRETFKDGFLQFNERNEYRNKDFIGELATSHKDPTEMILRNIILDDFAAKAIVCRIVNPAIQNPGVLKLLFLQDGNLAVFIANVHLFIWSPETKQTLFELRSPDQVKEISSLAQLPNGHLAAGDYEGYIDIWDLDAQRLVTTLEKQAGAVAFLGALQDGKLASFTRPPFNFNALLHDTEEKSQIIIWKATSETVWSPTWSVLVGGDLMDLRVLKNENLAFSYTDRSSGFPVKIVNIYNTATQEFVLISSLPIDERKCVNGFFLPDGDMLMHFEDGTIDIYSTEKEDKCYTSAIRGGIMGENLLKVVQSASHVIQIVRLRSIASLVPSNTDDASGLYVYSSSISQDGKRIALGSSKGDLVIVPLGD